MMVLGPVLKFDVSLPRPLAENAPNTPILHLPEDRGMIYGRENVSLISPMEIDYPRGSGGSAAGMLCVPTTESPDVKNGISSAATTGLPRR